MNTPWGKSDSKTTYLRGVSFVTTPSHGGFAVAVGAAHKLLSPSALQRAERWEDYYFFEEDCDAYIVLLEIPATRENITEEAIHKSLSYWHADYLIERGIVPTAEGLIAFNDHKQHDRMRADKSPELIVAAGHPTTKESSTPNEDVIVWTADGKRWLILHSEYTVKTLNLLSEYTNPREVQA